MGVSEILEAREKVNEGTRTLEYEAKAAIKDCVDYILSVPGIDCVSWSQKSSEYDDEGMYPGVWGPVINDPFSADDGGEWAYGYGSVLTDPRCESLKKVLEAIGSDILSNIFGDEYAVDATYGNDGRIRFHAEYAGC